MSNLELDVEDIAKYADKVVEIHLDYFGIEPVRRLELFGNGIKYNIDLLADQVEMHKKRMVFMVLC